MYSEYGIPIVLHGDKVPFTKTQGLVVISFTFLLAEGLPMLDQCFLICCFPYSAVCHPRQHGVSTFQVLWTWIVWSFNTLFDGRHSIRDALGGTLDLEENRNQELLADGYFGIVWVLCHDMEYGSNDLGCRHFNSDVPCDFCQCNRSTRSLTDVRPDALWKATKVSTVDGHRAPPSDHLIWKIKGV